MSQKSSSNKPQATSHKPQATSHKLSFLIGTVIILFALISFQAYTLVTAEQSGSTPNSNSTSRVKTLYDVVGASGLNYGSDTNTPNWGSMWNRIYSAAAWNAGLADASVGDVKSGKKFYAGANRDLQTGTLAACGATIDFTNQAYSFRDDYGGPTNVNGSEDYQGEEATWTNTNSAAAPNKVWKDERTGLYWSNTINTNLTNNFDIAICPYFSITPSTSLSTYDGLNANCGAAINACALSTVGGRSNWYLPSQKELMQAYVDGIYNKAGTTLTNAASFTNMDTFHSSSEVSQASTYSWGVAQFSGNTYNFLKANGSAVRCVSRD